MSISDDFIKKHLGVDPKGNKTKPVQQSNQTAGGNVAVSFISKYSDNNYLKNITPTVPSRQSTVPKTAYEEKSRQYDTEITSIKNLLDRYNTIGANYGMGGEEQDEVIQNERAQLLGSYGFKSIRDVEKKLEELQSGKWEFDNKIKYDYLFENADYADQSKVTTTEKTAGFGIGIGTGWWGKGDPVYDYINDLEGARTKMGGSALSGGTPYSIYDYMNPEEISDYNYLYNTEGKDAAKEYLDYLEYTLNARRTGTVKENAAKLADEAPVLSSAISVPANLMGGIGALDVAGQNLVKGVKEGVTGEYAGPVDYNRATMTPSAFSTTVRSTVSQNIIDSTGMIELDVDEHPILSKLLNGKSWADVYQLGMSMADSATIALMAPYVGTAGTYLLGGSAATQGMLDAVERGATDGQALTMGILNGAFEVLFEKYELEHLLGADSNILKALVNQALTEGVGEGATTIANTVADVLIMADKSEYSRNVAAYMEQGLSRKDAEKQALLDFAIQTGWDFVGGMASGGIMGTIASPIESAQQRYEEALRNYSGSQQELVDVALEINPDNAFAQRMQGRLGDGKDLSGRQLNRLVQQNEKALTAQDMTTIQTAAESRLTELGETGDVSAIAAALTKQAAGQKLTKTEQQAIAGSKYGQRVANELNTENIQSGDYSSQWAQKLDTERINVEEYSRLVEAAQLPQEATEATGVQGVPQIPKMAQGVQTGAVQEIATAAVQPRNDNQVAAASDQQVTGKLTGKKSLQVESQYEVSTDGKAEFGGKAVVLNGFKKMEDGSIAVATADNQTAVPSEVKYPSKGHALVYEVYANLESTAKNPVISGMDVDTRSALAKAYDPASGVSAKAYVVGSNQAYWYGFEGITMDEKTISQNSLVRNITEEQRAFAYDLGKKAGKQAAATQDAGIQAAYEKAVEKLGGKKAAAAISKKNKGKVIYEDSLRKSGMTKKQRASAALAEHVAKATGADIHVYHGMNEYGKYDPETGEIWLNINGNFKGSSMMAFTLAHELVHMAKQWSPAEFKAFADYLLEQYGKKGVSVEALIQEQMANAKLNGYTLDEHAAYEEVIADACQRMLLDSDALQKMAGYREQNPSKWQQIVEAIRRFIGNIRKLFEGAEADSMEASIYKEFDEDAKQFLEKLFVNMVMDAGEHMSTIRNAFGKGTVVEVNENGEFTLAKGEDSVGGKKFLYNDYTWERGGRDTLKAALEAEGYSKDDINAALTIMDGKHQLVKELAEQFPEQDRINQATVTTDLKDGHSVLSALVSNGDYPVNIDLLMVCKKRKAYQRVINRLCETGLIQQATVDALAIAQINKILGKYGFETACLGCFVESRRLRIQEWANTIVKEWNAEVKKRNPEAKAFGFGKGEGTLTPDEVMQLIGELESGGAKNDQGNLNLGQGSAVKRMGVLLDKVPSLRRTLSVEDLITPDGLTALRKFDSNLFSMVKSRYGSNSPKFVQEFNPYNHELAMYGKVPSEYKSLREYLYAIGGARMQSFSDFIVENWFDYCQIVADLSARKLPMHTYTKEIALAKLFGQTGIKINMSLIPDIDRSLGKEFAGLTRNENGELELIWADKDRFKATGGESYMQSINFADAVALQNDPRYSSNVGTIAVGVSDKHILTMLDDARVRMIIPYHSSGMNPIFADLMGTSYYKDYTMFQNTTVKQLYNSKGEPASVKLEKAQNDKLVSGFQFNEVLQELGDARAAAQAYKDWCADASKHTITIKGETYTAELTPKFDSFSWHDNYYKLLEDFNTYDSISEKAAPQGDVQQIYPENFSQILTDELTAQEGHRQKQAESQAFDKAMGEIESYLLDHTKADTVFYAEQHGINLAAKDKKLGAADKQKLADLRKGTKMSMPKVNSPYSYDSLISKPDMAVTTVGENVPNNRADLVYMAKQNAAMVGKIDPKSGSVSVYVKDIGRDVGIGRDGLKHSLDGGRISVNAPILVKAGEIISNSIRINELTPREDRIDESYVLIGAARNADNDLYIVSSVVNRFTHKLVSLDVLYAINAKKEPAALLPLSAGSPALGTDSTISIAKLLDYVNQYFPDVLPEEVLKHYGHDSRPDGKLGEDALYKNPNTHGMSSRQLLADAFDELVQTPKERELMDQYRHNITKVEEVQERLKKLRGEISQLTNANGDKNKIADLSKTASGLADLIDRYDRKLLELEASKPLKDVLRRAQSAAYQEAKTRHEKTMKEYRQQVSERFDRGVEGRRKTEMRHKIQNVVKELNDLLLNESKKRHVPDTLKKSVADALALVNMDTVEAEERAAKYAALIAKEQAKAEPDQAKIDAYTATMENILRQGDKMGQRLKDLRDAYEEIQESDDPDIANAYDPVIAGAIKELTQTIGNTSIRNMTLDQLSDVYDVYRMVLIRVRDANKALLENIKESIGMLASATIGEVRKAGGEHTHRAAILDPAKKFLWNNLKPVYAMEMIGSPTLIKVFNNVRAGEDTWAKDVTEAREFYLDKSKKYGYDSWDFKKKFSFESASGLKFELTLEQILSLYAYSKRDQAHDHLRLGGFVFDSNIETYKDDNKVIKYKVNTADAHQITPEILGEITGKLTKEQMGFVDEMQEYLSTVMGAKGNEVTSKMYAVKLFKEKFYFPLKSAKQFMFEQNEVSGEVKIKNSGFTNKVVAKANNPVILSNFMDVWAGHVNDMSMYHAFTLPLEDFNRVFNYNSPKQEGQPPVSVKGTIQSAYSPSAVNYVKTLITDLNGGARTDSTTGFINKAMGLFKKGSVFASASVVIQQPSAIARAAALVDTKYFIGPKIDHKTHKQLWDEVKQYAPVAIIKEMGYFDTNMGKSTQDFIQGKEYSGFKNKMKALVTDGDYRDEVLSKAPALADEIAWCGIWEAVKRETKAKNPGVDAKSEAFLQMVGERFTEVITKTQVYDSVLSRSGNMRSKDTGMKMATAFMAEPTTSINMIADALLKGKKGNWKYARKAIGAVIASQLLNAILVSFVYAGRDDDEDETYWEKYIGSVTGEFLDSLNPATYIPFIKDIVSIVQGYDVERSDMTVISDLWKSIENLSKDNVSAYRKVEGFAGSIAQIFGLPVKNIMRDARGIYQTVVSAVNGQQTTVAGIGYAIKGAVTRNDVSDQQQLYEAYLSGNQAHIDRVKGRFKDQNAVNTAIRKALRENDPRIHEAAIAWNANDLDEYMRIAKEIIAEKHFVQDDVVMAIRAEASALEPDEGTSGTSKAKGLFTEEKFAEAVTQRNAAMANAIKADIIKTAMLNGKTRDEAEKSFATSASAKLKDQFLAGNLTENEAVNALTTYCGRERDAAMADVQYWAFKQKYPETYADDQWFDTYYAKVADSGLDIEVYMEYRNAVSTITGEGRKERRIEIIHSLPITKEQKDALYLAEGWAESKLYEAPWH